ncbi:MAG: hypothetical protein AB1650_05285 [Candidatus Omnitrophota bacterium]
MTRRYTIQTPRKHLAKQPENKLARRGSKILQGFACSCALALLIGCYKSPPPVKNLSEAHVKFEQLLKTDFSQNPVVIRLPNTLYIYVPVSFDILKTQASVADFFSLTRQEKKRQINFAETVFEEPGLFHISYDITEVNSYPKSPGYTSSYTDEFSSLHNNLLSALSRSFSDVVEGQGLMDFVTLMIVDIRNGIAIKNIFHFNDLKLVMAGSLPQDEYVLRYMTELLGSPKFIDNPTARGLNPEDITWREFIARQITYRINFKYGRSSFPPMENDVKEIIRIARETLRAYNFDDFRNVQMENLATKEVLLFDKSQLESF